MWTHYTFYFLVLILLNTSIIQSKPKAESILEPNSHGKWQLEKMNGKSPRAGSLSVRFHADGTMSGFGGCNGMSGQYSIDTDKKSIQVIELLRSTRACGDKTIMDQENSFSGMLGNISKYNIVGNKLILITKKNETLIFKFLRKRKYGNKLSGKKWVLTGYSLNTWILQSTRAIMTLHFKDGGFRAISACHELTGKYVKSGNKLRFHDVKIRDKNCQGSKKVENKVRDILKGARTFKLIRGEILYIHNKEKLKLEFEVS
ncbi:MAG: META domain-containing protein [Spirochaetota bacterium]|nr:META domain-containing protein [Spirochaetota bacterium]